jgi:tricorn protease
VSTAAYLRHPTISGDLVVFVAEDDLWAVASSGGTAHRITANPGSISRPRLSPDGKSIAYVSRDEGVRDAWVMNADGSASRRITFFGSVAAIAAWTPDGSAVIVVSDHDQPFAGFTHLWSVPLDGGPPTKVPVGHAWSASFLPSGGLVLGRNAFDPARWKRYRGGRAGQIWADRNNSGEFEPLVDLAGNLADPMAIGSRVYFLSDHEGVGNVYSATPTGRNIRRHTHHEAFYVRYPSSDGRRIVYHAGGDLYLTDPYADRSEKIDVVVPSTRPQRNRRFISPGRFVESFDLHPEGHSLALDIRGSAFTMPLWEGTPMRLTAGSAVRDRVTHWLPDGERIASITDSEGEEHLIVRNADGTGQPEVIDVDLGRVRSIVVAPAADGMPTRIATTNHRHELSIVDIDAGTARVVHRSPFRWIGGTAWSPDGRWLAFCARQSETTQDLLCYDTLESRLHVIGSSAFVDHNPTFDPDGRYLYFLSSRVFDPVPDSVFHDYGFPSSTIVMIAPLQSGTPVPFRLASKDLRSPGGNGSSSKSKNEKKSEGSEEQAAASVAIDFSGLADRIESLPIPAGRHLRLRAASGRVYVLSYPVRGALGTPSIGGDPPKGVLSSFDLSTDTHETVAEGVTAFDVSADGKTLAIWNGSKLRVVAVGWKDDKSGKESVGRDTGFIDMARVRVEIEPGAEWRQMFTEAWRLQRDYFWSEDMTGVDWVGVHDRYLALTDRIASRSEFSDLLWEMQGELGTSHAYELGGEYRPEPGYTLGRLGADVEWQRGAWRVRNIPRGDSWNPVARSPLARSGVDIEVGDRILSIDGVALDRDTPPDALLVDRGGRTVAVEVARGRRRPRRVIVEPLKAETALRYRDWVESNRQAVRDATGGRCGYIHIPDMGAPGFAEFHRSWRGEVTSDGLVIDVRFNRGGNVSQLLLQKLLRDRLGYRVTRWSVPRAFPTDAPAGPMVCLTNEFSGSDGDIFSHTFKMHGLGPLIGTRTWGGVVGIWPQQSLVDGTVTTQPEFGTWFHDAEFSVENYGTDPDIEVVIAPHDYGAGRDLQMVRALDELMRLVTEHDLELPDFSIRPSTEPPRLD